MDGEIASFVGVCPAALAGTIGLHPSLAGYGI
jgi:hypothetical protein